MNFIIVGTSHKYSPIQIREQLAFPKKIIKQALADLLSQNVIRAAVIVSTCNRVEIYAHAQEEDSGIQALKTFFCRFHVKESSKIEPWLYTYIGKEALRHLFRVAGGLDSQIIGERQIAEQVAFAYAEAKSIEATDRFLERIFLMAGVLALKLRQESRISDGDISIATIVHELLRAKFSQLTGKQVLMIGTGKVSQLCSEYLVKEGAGITFVAHKHFLQAKILAQSLKAKLIKFAQLKEKIREADILIAATASPHLVIKPEDVQDTKKPLLILDLALPRDVDYRVKESAGISLFDLDALSPFINEKLRGRYKAIPRAEAILQEEVENLCWEEDCAWASGPARSP